MVWVGRGVLAVVFFLANGRGRGLNIKYTVVLDNSVSGTQYFSQYMFSDKIVSVNVFVDPLAPPGVGF